MTIPRRPYLLRVLDWLTQGANTVLFNGEPDDSTSGRSHSECRKGKKRWCLMERAINYVFLMLGVESDHCAKAHKTDLMRSCSKCSGE